MTTLQLSSFHSTNPNQNTLAVFGHKTPDTDAIIGAIAGSEWLNQRATLANQTASLKAIAYRLGEINKETRYLLNLAGISEPPLLPTLPAQSPVALIDHNESQQSVQNLSDLQILYVIDHHKLGDLTTREPAFLHFRPVGSSCTILYELLQQDNCHISPQLALLMAGAIVSDTLNLTSPTTTATDRYVLAKLQHLANIDNVQDFALQLFKAKSDVSDLTAEQMITSDYKQFIFADKKWGIAVIETVNPEQIFKRIQELNHASHTIRQNDNLDYLLVIIVDILYQKSWAIRSFDEQNRIVATALDTNPEDNLTTHADLIDLGNRVSRKKQFVPALEGYYKDLAILQEKLD